MLIASLTMSAYFGPLGAAAAFGAIIMSDGWQRGQQEAQVRAKLLLRWLSKVAVPCFKAAASFGLEQS